MKCEEFQFAIGAEPNTTRVEVLEHAAACPECARYRSDMREMNDVIHKALSIDTEAPVGRSASKPSGGIWRLAASLFVAAVLVSLFWVAYPRETLATELVGHVLHEPNALTASYVDPTTVEDVMKGAGLQLKPGALNVTYATTCPFRGQQVPHFVVQTREGPVTVLVMPNETSVKEVRSFEEQGLAGTLLPTSRGAIAVLGENPDLEGVARQVMAALDYQ